VKQIVIFGGTGFIGTHTAQRLLQEPGVEQVVLVDIGPPRTEQYTAALQAALASGKARFVQHDIRQPTPQDKLPKADLIFNFAAVHREPGHDPREYYETNLQGATNVCDYATAVDCRHVVFTSSISPYGPSEDAKHEGTLPVPETPYGGSKLVAEVLGRCDAEGVPAYLETQKEANLAYYRRHRFELAETLSPQPGGPSLWTMLREPASP